MKSVRRRNVIFDCPECRCRFLTERDLEYHAATHRPQPRAPVERKQFLPLEERREKYAEKLRLFRLNYCGEVK